MADNIQINTGTSGVFVKTKEVAAGTHAGYTILADTAGALFGTPTNPVSITGTGLVVSGTVTATPTGTQACSIAATIPVSGTFYQATQPISGTVVVTTMPVLSATNVTIASITTGTVTALPSGTQACAIAATVPVSGTFYQATQPVSGSITVASLTTGTVNVVSMPVLSASNVTIASIATGTMTVIAHPAISGSVSVINAPTVTVSSLPVISGTGLLLGATTAGIGAVFAVSHPTRWNACAISTTSGGGHAIIKTSGAHTLYVTDLLLSVDVPMTVSFYSSSADQAPVAVAYCATKGGLVMNLNSPIVLTSAQSFVFIGSLSGSCAAFAAGYTVT